MFFLWSIFYFGILFIWRQHFLKRVMGIIWVCLCFAVRREETVALYSRVFFTHFHRGWDMGLGALAASCIFFPGRVAFFRFCFSLFHLIDSGNEVENVFVLFSMLGANTSSTSPITSLFRILLYPVLHFLKRPWTGAEESSAVQCTRPVYMLFSVCFTMRHHFFLSSGGNISLLVAFGLLMLFAKYPYLVH